MSQHILVAEHKEASSFSIMFEQEWGVNRVCCIASHDRTMMEWEARPEQLFWTSTSVVRDMCGWLQQSPCLSSLFMFTSQQPARLRCFVRQ